MTRSILEADWKVFRALSLIALDRFCHRVLSEVAEIASDAGKTNHERYLAVYTLIEKRNEELADAFDDHRRSTALLHLARMRWHKLLTDEEMSRFSAETLRIVGSLHDLWRT
jgi:hypothetical protein